MSWRRSGRPYSAMNLDEQAQIRLLGGDAADIRNAHLAAHSGVWGKAVKLTASTGLKAMTVVQTGPLDMITPIAFQFTFSLDGANFSPTLPVGSNPIDIQLVRSIDPHTGPFIETFGLDEGDGVPLCQVIARALTIGVRLTGENPADLYVHAAAAPVTAIDCEAINPVAGSDVYTDVEAFQLAASTVVATLCRAADPRIRSTIVQNLSATDVYLGLGSFIPTVGPPSASSIVLPGGQKAVWASGSNFRGDIRAIFPSGGSASEFVTFTTGLA